MTSDKEKREDERTLQRSRSGVDRATENRVRNQTGKRAPELKLKSRCCKKYSRKAKACKGCPVIAILSKSERRKKLRKVRKKLREA